MFRQVLIQEDQRHLQTIIWRESPSEPLSLFKLNTVTYGTASAPYLSMRCVRQLGHESTDADISLTLLNDMYVDDCIFGNDDETELIRICKGVIEVCKSGCLPLRKWVFNSNKIAKEIVKNDDSQSKHFTLNDNCSNKTLGLGWLNNDDEFHFISKIKEISTPITKRLILSVVSQVYDPLGLLSPVIIKAKILLQKLWLCKLDWDDEVPLDIKVMWEKFVTSLSALHDIRVPRHILCTNPVRTELHIFTDASETAYGACAYSRSISETDDVTVRLICSKSRVAPVKPISIPRLELCGALVGAILLERITKAVKLKFDKIVCWTDSTIVLGWLKMSPQQLKPFVQNRVVQINEYSSNAKWLHVNGKHNPADLVSRDDKGIIRVGGRLSNSPDFSYNKKHPMLLCDPSDYTPLTPAHFLIGRPLTSPASADVTNTPLHALSRYKRLEQLRQHFWRRWSAEYIGELQTRTKWKESKGVLAPNTLVLIKEDNLPPLKWRLGRILSVFPGKDGVPRVASIQTANGVIERAFSKICPLPVSTNDEDAAATKPIQGR